MKIKDAINSKILFYSKLEKIKNDELREYWKTFFSLKTILLKVIILLIVATIVMSTSFGLRQIFIDYFPNLIFPNEGISFSFLSNVSSEIVYLIQAIPCVLTFIAFIFINKPSIYIGLLIILFGGLSNIIDRSLNLNIIVAGGKLFPNNAVVDYIPLFNTKCNLPDVFITCGAVITIIFLLIYLVKVIQEDRKENNAKF